MSGDLIVVLGFDAEPSAWAARRRGRTEIGGADTLAGALAQKPDRIVAVAPGEDVVGHAVTLPVTSEARARRAAPFAIEDKVAVDPARLHVALGPLQVETRARALAVAEPDLVAAWTASLARLGLAKAPILADYQLLGSPDGAPTVTRIGERVAASWPGGGFTIDAAVAGPVVRAALGRLEAPGARLFGVEDLGLPEGLAADGRAVEAGPALGEEVVLARMLDALAREPAGLDLRQGAFADRAGAGLDLTLWRRAFVLAGLAGLAWIGLLALEGVQLDRAAARTDAEARDIFRAAFPNVQRIVNLRAQTASELDALRAGAAGGFLELSAALAEGVAPIEAMSIEAVRFDASRGELAATLVYADFADMQVLKTNLEARGLQVAEGGARARGAATTGEVVISWP